MFVEILVIGIVLFLSFKLMRKAYLLGSLAIAFDPIDEEELQKGVETEEGYVMVQQVRSNGSGLNLGIRYKAELIEKKGIQN